MARPILVRINIDDKGNKAILQLAENARRARKPVSSLGDAMKKAFAFVGLYRGLQLLNTQMREAVSNAVKFEKALKDIEGITGKSTKEVGRLADEALRLSAATEHSATGIAQATLAMTKMGFKVTKTIEALPHILDLATASGEDLNWVATNSINIMKAFGMSANEMERIANVVATALNATSLNLEDYMEAMKFVAPIAAATGVSLEEASTVLGVLADQSIRGSIGGTQLKNMLLNLLKATPATTKALAGMNMESMSLTAILKGLHDAQVPVGEILKQFNKRAVAGALAIGANEEAVTKLNKALTTQARKAKDVAAIMRTSVQSLGIQILNTFNTMGVEIFRIFEEDIRRVLANFLDRVRQIYAWVSNNQDKIRDFARGFTEEFGNIAQAVKLLLPILGKLTGGTDDFAQAGRNLATVLKAIVAIKLYGHLTQMSAGLATMGVRAGVASSAMRGFAASMNVATAAAMALYFAMDLALQAQDKRSEKKAGFLDDPSKVKDALKHLEDIAKKEKEINELQKEEDQHKRMRAIKKVRDEIGKIQAKVRDISGMSFIDDANILTVANLKQNLHARAAHADYVAEKAREAKEAQEKARKEAAKPYGSLITPSADAEADRLRAEALRKEQEYAKLVQALWDEVNQRIADRWTREAKAQGVAWDIIIEEANKAEQAALDFQKKQEERQKNSLALMEDSVFSTYNSIADIINSFSQAQLQDTLDRLEDEEKGIQKRYNMELALAENNAVRKAIAEKRLYTQQMALERKKEAANEKAAKRQKVLATLTATADMFRGILGIMADTKGGLISRTAAGVAYTAIAAGYLAQLAAVNLRSGGVVQGPGNATSDNVPAMLSPGEMVLSNDTIRQAGGPNMIQQMIDRGSSYTSNTTKNVHIDTVIGTDEFVREQLIPVMELEASR